MNNTASETNDRDTESHTFRITDNYGIKRISIIDFGFFK